MKTIYSIIKMILPIMLLLNSIDSISATLYSIKNGKWSNGTNWSYTSGGSSCNCVPISSDNIYIETTVYADFNMISSNGFSGILNIRNGATFDATSFNIEFKNNSQIYINGNLKVKDLTFYDITHVVVGSTGLITVYGNFTNKNNSTDIVIHGSMEVYGTFYNMNHASITGTGFIHYYGSFTDEGYISGYNDGISLIKLSNPLPVVISQMMALQTMNGNQIIWTTQSEINNHYFSIEKSTDLITWEEIAVIPGAGNSNSKIEYSYTDNTFSDPVSYYRVKQTDYDGKYVYFDILIAKKEVDERGVLVSNYSTDQTSINLVLNIASEIPVTIWIHDLSGKLVYEKNVSGLGLTYLSMNLPNILNGLYIINLKQGNDTQVLKIHKL